MVKIEQITKNQTYDIHLTRGDTFIATLSFVDSGGNTYTPDSTDTITFRAKKFIYSSEISIEKTVSYSTLLLQLSDSDTYVLDFGSYVFEVEIVTSDGYHFTVINGNLYIENEVENHG